MGNIFRLDSKIRSSGIPIDGVSGIEGKIRIDFKPEATDQQITDANAIVSNFDWSSVAHAAWLNLENRKAGKSRLDGLGSEEKLLRAITDIARNEINILRQWLASFKAQVAGATSLSDLKTRVATLPATPDRTLSQLKISIKNKIDSGDVDI